MDLREGSILLDTFVNGAKVFFVCSVGFEATGGSPSITCINGSWTPVTLKCESEYQHFTFSVDEFGALWFLYLLVKDF